MKLRYIIAIIVLLLSIVPYNIKAQQISYYGDHLRSCIYDLTPFERAICCIKFYEGLHTEKDYPYVGYGHKLVPGEHYPLNMTPSQADKLLRKDLIKLCGFFRTYGDDSLLLATLAYNVGVYRIKGNRKIPKSNLLKKIESGVRNFYADYLGFCKWKGRKVASIERRRYVELLLLCPTA